MLSLKPSLLFISKAHGIPCSHIHEIIKCRHNYLPALHWSTSSSDHTCLQQQQTEHIQKNIFQFVQTRFKEKEREENKSISYCKLFPLHANSIKRLKWPWKMFHEEKGLERKVVAIVTILLKNSLAAICERILWF